MPQSLFRKVFASMSALVMVGSELGRPNSEWQTLSMSFVQVAVVAPGNVKTKYPSSLYWLSKYLDDGVKTMLKCQQRGSEILQPALAARIAASKSETETKHRTAPRKYEDAIQWLLDAHARTSKGRQLTPYQLTQDLFTIMTASVHSTTGAALAILLDMIEHPEALEDIKQEIARVKGKNPVWTRKALGELQILDSFMRESSRVHGLTQCEFESNGFPYHFRPSYLYVKSGSIDRE